MGKATTVTTAVVKLKNPITKKGQDGEEEKSVDTKSDAKKNPPKAGGSSSTGLVKKVSKVDDDTDDPIA